MNWFEILKVLGTKTGFSQLDFDNVVIEDEDDCLKRLKELNRKIHQYGKSYSTDTEWGVTKFPDTKSTFYDLGKTLLTVADEVPEFTEEVACEILEFIKNIKTAETRGSEGLKYYFSIETDENWYGGFFSRLYFSEGTKGATWGMHIEGNDEFYNLSDFEGWLSGLV